ncbi:DUF885 domain-containing protein [Gimibacter soli]|uniref:DUF885 domain-containing protein n=1 Tax=Gimibacter soli TaxID=3024400 RepID=A0AAE9XUJ0_9PROT|nr:DUF885 domain-containing protein [Gimibacter soli]WCL54800.1 DUF885 domain-containing protein [Gimibacter soli]
MLRTSVSALSLLLALAACEPAAQKNDSTTAAPATEKPSAEAEVARLNAFFEKAMQDQLALNPLYQESLGDHSQHDKWPSSTVEAQDQELALTKAQLAEAEGFDASVLPEASALSLTLFKKLWTRNIEDDKFRNDTYVFNQMYGAHTRPVTHLLTVHRLESKEDAEAFVTRLATFDAYLGEEVDRALRAEKAGVLPPKFVYPRVLTSIERIVAGAPFDDSGTDNVLLAHLKTKIADIEMSDEDRAAIIASAEKALTEHVKPGYDRVIAELTRQEGLANEDAGVWKFADGEAFYAQKLKDYTTTSLSAAEIHQIGLDNVARIHSEMEAIMKKVGFEGSLKDFFEFTRTDDRFFVEDSDAGRQLYIDTAKGYIDQVMQKAPEFFHRLPKAPLEVRAVEKFRETSAGKAFYQRPAPDGSRPGAFYANLKNVRDMPLYQLEALAYHEGAPGHHFQIAVTQELEGVPLFQRSAGFTAYSEGWGLYTEELGKDMGFYTDPYSDFGRLAMELWRACRLVVDTGLHDKRWTREQAIQYLIDNTPNPEGDSTSAIERYIVMPGQATAYMIGKLKIMELRTKAQTELGDKFTYADFHDVVLKHGFLPLDILEEKVNGWIAASKG